MSCNAISGEFSTAAQISCLGNSWGCEGAYTNHKGKPSAAHNGQDSRSEVCLAGSLDTQPSDVQQSDMQHAHMRHAHMQQSDMQLSDNPPHVHGVGEGPQGGWGGLVGRGSSLFAGLSKGGGWHMCVNVYWPRGEASQDID